MGLLHRLVVLARDARGPLAQFLRGVTRKHQFASFRDMSHILNAGGAQVRAIPLAGSLILHSRFRQAVTACLRRARPRDGRNAELATPCALRAGGKG